MPNTGIGPDEEVIAGDNNVPASATRIRIPSINVDAAIQEVGLTKNGSVGAPNNVSDVGWLNISAAPGENGTALIDGHLVSRHNGNVASGVFDNLSELKAGDKIYIDYSNREIVYVVKKIGSYGANAEPSEPFIVDGGSHLNLITCAGVWDSKNKEYTKRVVVFADLSA